MTHPTLQQLTVTCARDLALRLVDHFHQGSETEKQETKRAFINMTQEMFRQGVPPIEQCKFVLKAMTDALELGTWPDEIIVGQADHPHSRQALASRMNCV